MFFYSAATHRKRPNLISHQAREHAGEKFKDFMGKKLGLGRTAAQQKSASKPTLGRMNIQGYKRDETMKELDELKKFFDSILKGTPNKEISNIFMVAYQGIQSGKIRGNRDVAKYFLEWFKKLAEKDPGYAQQLTSHFGSIEKAAIDSAQKFNRVFDRNIKLRKSLQGRYEKLAYIARQ